MNLLLGPVLRHVGATTASVWVQTDRPGTVTVLGRTARTFQVRGCHYALVQVTGLTPDTVTPYHVELDNSRIWPPPDYPFPTPVIRTRGPASETQARMIFGSCRYPKTGDAKLDKRLGPDALDEYALRASRLPVDQLPDALILLGDQVYADELMGNTLRRVVRTRRSERTAERPSDEVVTYEEYERLYRESWSDPEIRWLMSTVPTAMIFDDHDVRDDWNTSAAWRAEMAATPWWPERIRAGLASYWVYQHLGNLGPTELAEDQDYQRVQAHEGDCWPLLAELADRADREVDGAKGAQFSFHWQLGRTRLVMIDSRNGRILDSASRAMLGEREFAFVAERMTEHLERQDHLVIGSSLPWLMPHAISDLQAINERCAERPGWVGRLNEKLRQAGDLEHWPAFDRSFRRLSELIAQISSSEDAPATVTVLSGDVHHSYAARASFARNVRSSVYQLVCSPVHNHVPAFIRPVFRLGWSRPLGALTRRAARAIGLPPLPVHWRKVCGPLYGNTIATLEIRGRAAEVRFEQPRAGRDGPNGGSARPELTTVASIALTEWDESAPPSPGQRGGAVARG